MSVAMLDRSEAAPATPVFEITDDLVQYPDALERMEERVELIRLGQAPSWSGSFSTRRSTPPARALRLTNFCPGTSCPSMLPAGAAG